jgi:hypothetical protein
VKTRLATCALFVGLSAALFVPGTSAWLSDLEEGAGGRFSAESVNVAVDGQDEWTHTYHVGESRGGSASPAEGGVIGFPIENLGNSPVDVWKRINGVSAYGDLDPEQVEYTLKLDNRWLIAPSRTIPVSSVADRWIYVGRLAPGQTTRIDQTFHLKRSPGKKTEDPSGGFSFDDQVLALQTSGAPSPVPELSGYGR